MIDNKILDKILLSLADQYESGRTDRCVTLTVTTPEGFEPFRETMAGLRAEGSINMTPSKSYQMTASGYAKYSDKVRELRVLAS